MQKTKIFSLFVSLIFMQWHGNSVGAADTSEAKVTGATQKTDNPYFAAVEDEDAKSGWAVEVKKAISEDETSNMYVFFYTRTDPQAKFKESFATSFCNLLSNDGETNVLPKQAIDMIFPRQKGSCVFKVSERAIRAAAQVNTNFDDNGGYLPKTTPYELEVRILDYEQASGHDREEYLFGVNFNVGGDINKK